ncbi:MAG: transporter [Burkholderiaceae bacterium]
MFTICTPFVTPLVRGFLSARLRDRKTAIAASTLLALLSPGLSLAFQPLITDDTGTQGTGGHQIEASYTRTRQSSAGDADLSRALAAVYTYGVSDALDLFISASHQVLEPALANAQSGRGNTLVGAKWRFHEDESNKLSFALRPELQLPVSTEQELRGLGTARTSWRLDVLMTQGTGFGAVHVNLASSGVNFDSQALNLATRRLQYRLSVAPVWDISEQFKLALDTGVMTNPDLAQKTQMTYVGLGAIHSPSQDLDVALGVFRYNGHDSSAKTLQWSAGLTYRFK